MNDSNDGSSQKQESPARQSNGLSRPGIERQKHALETIVAEHYEDLLQAARSHLGWTVRSQTTAFEFERLATSAVHTAFCRAVEPDKLAEFNPNAGDPRLWLYRFIHNVVREQKTQRAREYRHKLNPKRATLTSVSDLASSDQRLLSQDEQLSLRAELDTEPDELRIATAVNDANRLLRLLPKQDEELLQKKYVQGMTYADIAAETGDTVQALRKRAERALKKLRGLDGGSPAA